MRIRSADGHVLGAGMALGDHWVLTCAHAVAGRASEIAVDFPFTEEEISVNAAVWKDCWFPPQEGDRGDVAVLRMDTAVSEKWGVPLRRMPLRSNGFVRVCGFPFDGGHLWTTAGTGGAAGEWVQLNTDPDAAVVCSGFGGAGVIDSVSESVIGMVVGRIRDSSAFWMIPVDALVTYLPMLQRLVPAAANSKLDEPSVALEHRVQRLTDRLGELFTAECKARLRQRQVANRVTGTPTIPQRAINLRRRLSELRTGDHRRLLEELAKCERAVGQAQERLDAETEQLEELLGRRQDLRQRLEANRAEAAEHGVAEEAELARSHRRAHDMLWRAPCDLHNASDAVRRYEKILRRRLRGS